MAFGLSRGHISHKLHLESSVEDVKVVDVRTVGLARNRIHMRMVCSAKLIATQLAARKPKKSVTTL